MCAYQLWCEFVVVVFELKYQFFPRSILNEIIKMENKQMIELFIDLLSCLGPGRTECLLWYQDVPSAYHGTRTYQVPNLVPGRTECLTWYQDVSSSYQGVPCCSGYHTYSHIPSVSYTTMNLLIQWIAEYISTVRQIIVKPNTDTSTRVQF